MKLCNIHRVINVYASGYVCRVSFRYFLCTFSALFCFIFRSFLTLISISSLSLRDRSLETFQIPFETDDLAVLICNSNVRHELSHSEYPTRRKQCAKALELMGLNSYKNATIKSLEGKCGACTTQASEMSTRWCHKIHRKRSLAVAFTLSWPYSNAEGLHVCLLT